MDYFEFARTAFENRLAEAEFEIDEKFSQEDQERIFGIIHDVLQRIQGVIELVIVINTLGDVADAHMENVANLTPEEIEQIVKDFKEGRGQDA